MRILLRRFDGEPVEVSGAAAFGAFDLEENEETDAAGRRMRGYWVDVADGVHVVPVDRRWFAADVDFIDRAIAICVKDNLMPFAVEPRTPDLGRRCEGVFGAALRDLSSIILIRGLECCVGDSDQIQARIEYELVNRSRRNLVVTSFMA